jgi:hypothetical protein
MHFLNDLNPLPDALGSLHTEIDKSPSFMGKRIFEKELDK